MYFEEFVDFIGQEFQFDTTGIKPETTFAEINFDEFDMIELVMSIEDKYTLEISDEDLQRLQTVGDFAVFMNELLKKS